QTISVSVGDTNDNPPVIAPQDVTINENLANGTSVATMVATDADSGDVLTFEISLSSAPGVFSIDPATGLITVADSTALNFEAYTGSPTFSLTVTVTDAAGSTASAPLTISLADVNEAPTAIFLSGNNAVALGNLVIGQASAADEDIGDTLTFSLINDANGRFVINSADGTVSTSSSLGSISPPSGDFSIDIQVTDSAGNMLTRSFNISLNPTEDPQAPPPAPGPIPVDPPAPTPTPTPEEEEDADKPIGPTSPSIDDVEVPAAAPGETSTTVGFEEIPRAEPPAQRVRRTPSAEPVQSAQFDAVVDATAATPQEFGSWLFELLAIERGEMDFQRSIDTADAQQESDQPGSIEDFLRDPYKVSAAIVGTSAIWWFTRAAGLAVSLLIGSPTWRAIDPLPIVMPNDDDDDDSLLPTSDADNDNQIDDILRK
ncbi:MAG: cadherin repeat domain-containing protein, partial [Burkholderiaceae bacterium]